MAFFEHHGLEEKEFFRFNHLKTEGFPLHFHRAYEIIFVKKGTLYLTIEGKEYFVDENKAFFIFPNQMHGFKISKHSQIQLVIFSPELIGHFFENLKGLIPVDPEFSIQQFPEDFDFNTIYSKKSFLYSMCDILMKSTSFSQFDYSTKIQTIQKVVAYVDMHFSQPMTLIDVAESLQYDYAYLSRIFLQVTKISFTEFLNHYRISQACYYLRNTDKLISDIALDCGYQNMRSFHRNFKKIMHVLPGKYRSDSSFSEEQTIFQ